MAICQGELGLANGAYSLNNDKDKPGRLILSEALSNVLGLQLAECPHSVVRPPSEEAGAVCKSAGSSGGAAAYEATDTILSVHTLCTCRVF